MKETITSAPDAPEQSELDSASQEMFEANQLAREAIPSGTVSRIHDSEGFLRDNAKAEIVYAEGQAITKDSTIARSGSEAVRKEPQGTYFTDLEYGYEDGKHTAKPITHVRRRDDEGNIVYTGKIKGEKVAAIVTRRAARNVGKKATEYATQRAAELVDLVNDYEAKTK